MVDYPLLGLIALAIAIYAALFREIRKWQKAVAVNEAFDKEIVNIFDRAELIRAMRSDIAKEADREWEGHPFALDTPDEAA